MDVSTRYPRGRSSSPSAVHHVRAVAGNHGGALGQWATRAARYVLARTALPLALKRDAEALTTQLDRGLRRCLRDDVAGLARHEGSRSKLSDSTLKKRRPSGTLREALPMPHSAYQRPA